mgnify:CR=1 FL=1
MKNGTRIPAYNIISVIYKAINFRDENSSNCRYY